jgi:peroxiredoxin
MKRQFLFFMLFMILLFPVYGENSDIDPPDEMSMIKEIYETESPEIRRELIEDYFKRDDISRQGVLYVYRISMATLHELEDYDAVERMLPDYFLALEERDPIDKAQAANEAAYILAESLKYTKEAIAWGEKALEYFLSVTKTPRGVDPGQWEDIKIEFEAGIRDTIGYAYYRDMNDEKALPWLEQAVSLNPADANIRYHHGLVLERLGRIQEAWESFLYARYYAFFESSDIERALSRLEGKQAGDWQSVAVKNKIKAEAEQVMRKEALQGEIKREPAPKFELTDLDGNTVAVSDYLGRVCLIDFWATWCGPCQQEMPILQSFYEEFHSKGVEILAVSVDGPDTWEKVPGFVRDKKISFPVFLDQAEAAAAYGVQTIPALFVLDRKGNIRFVHNGFEPGLYKKLYFQAHYLLNEE